MATTQQTGFTGLDDDDTSQIAGAPSTETDATQAPAASGATDRPPEIPADYTLPAIPTITQPATRQEEVDAARMRRQRAWDIMQELTSAAGRARWWDANYHGIDPSHEPAKLGGGTFGTEPNPDWIKWDKGTRELNAELARAQTQYAQADTHAATVANQYYTYQDKQLKDGIAAATAQAKAYFDAQRVELISGRLDLDRTRDLVTAAGNDLRNQITYYNDQIKANEAQHTKELTTATAMTTAVNSAVDAAQKQLAPVGSTKDLYGALNDYRAQHGMSAVAVPEPPTTTLGDIRRNATDRVTGTFKDALAALPEYNAAAGIAPPVPSVTADDLRNLFAGSGTAGSQILGPLRPGTGAAGQYGGLVDAAAQKYGLDPSLLGAMVGQESSGNASAVSPMGAQGLMQLMPATAAKLGVKNPFDPAENIDAGARYFKQLLDNYGGDEKRALVAYNGGQGAVSAMDAGKPYGESSAYLAGIYGRRAGPPKGIEGGIPLGGGDIPDSAKAAYGDPAAVAAAAAAEAASAAGGAPAAEQATGPSEEQAPTASPMADVSDNAFGHISAGLNQSDEWGQQPNEGAAA